MTTYESQRAACKPVALEVILSTRHGELDWLSRPLCRQFPSRHRVPECPCSRAPVGISYFAMRHLGPAPILQQHRKKPLMKHEGTGRRNGRQAGTWCRSLKIEYMHSAVM